MSPERKEIVNGHKVEEFYWAGRWPCYVDSQLSAESYDQTVARLREGKPPMWKK